MAIIKYFSEYKNEISSWRHQIHSNPELLFDVQETAEFIVKKLKEFGVDEIAEKIGKIGVVAVIKGQTNNSKKVIGLRADMDGLPINEETGLEYASKKPFKMHACGHDGHMAIILGVAKYLCQTRNFNGTAVLVFQPAEEGGGGGREMVEDGLMDRFGIQEIYGLHNWPGVELGNIGTRVGALMAAADDFTITITGSGGHAAKPHEAIDPIIVASHIIIALQSITSRNIDPFEDAVISVTKVNSGTGSNIIADKAVMSGTVRTLNADIQKIIEKRMHLIVENTAKAYGATAILNYQYGYPIVINHEKQTLFAIDIAKKIIGEKRVDTDVNPTMGSEDFSYMLNARPGCFIFMGNGDSAPIHNSKYDFNDEAIPVGCSYFADLIETAMPVKVKH